jgi:Xaa-Pro dipeptidase
MQEEARLAELLAAEKKAQALFDAIESAGLITAGRTERMVEKDIYALAEQSFGVTRHWHKRIVRSGINTLCIAADDPPVLAIGVDDTVFIDLGPVFDEWEADVGRTYVVGDDPQKQKLCRDLPVMFDAIHQHFHDHEDITGTELYAFAQHAADQAGWLFGGAIAGHLVGEFPHARIPGEKDLYRISPDNPGRMRDPDGLGREKYWIIEVHLVDRARTFGGFYERLLVPARHRPTP